MTVRYGVIGTGMMGIEHIENLNAIDGAVVTAISDVDEQSRAFGKRAAKIDDDAVFADHRELLASGLVDAVVVATPNNTHAEILMDVIDSGVHFLAEKPLTTTVADARRLVEAAEDYDAVAWMGLEYRYKPPIARLIDEVQSGLIGEPKMVFIREHRFPFLEKVGDWNRFTENTGGTLVEKCCHFFDLMNLLAGAAPVRVLASGGQDVNHLDEYYDGERSDILDNAFVIVDFDDGGRGLLDLCMFAEATHNQEELSVVGAKGKVEALIPEDVVRIGRRGEHWIGGVETHPVVNEEIPYEGHHSGSSWVEHQKFRDAVLGVTPPEVSLFDGLLSVAIGAAAHRSIDEGRPVELSEFLR